MKKSLPAPVIPASRKKKKTVFYKLKFHAGGNCESHMGSMSMREERQGKKTLRFGKIIWCFEN